LLSELSNVEEAWCSPVS